MATLSSDRLDTDVAAILGLEEGFFLLAPPVQAAGRTRRRLHLAVALIACASAFGIAVRLASELLHPVSNAGSQQVVVSATSRISPHSGTGSAGARALVAQRQSAPVIPLGVPVKAEIAISSSIDRRNNSARPSNRVVPARSSIAAQQSTDDVYEPAPAFASQPSAPQLTQAPDTVDLAGVETQQVMNEPRTSPPNRDHDALALERRAAIDAIRSLRRQ